MPSWMEDGFGRAKLSPTWPSMAQSGPQTSAALFDQAQGDTEGWGKVLPEDQRSSRSEGVRICNEIIEAPNNMIRKVLGSDMPLKCLLGELFLQGIVMNMYCHAVGPLICICMTMHLVSLSSCAC